MNVPRLASAVSRLGLTVVAVLALAAATCSPNPEITAVPTIAFTDDLGRAVILPKTAERIVSIGPDITEVLVALGLSSRIVGVDDYSEVPGRKPYQLGQPYLTGDALGPRLGIDVEAIAKLRPDVVLAEPRTTWGRPSRNEDSGDACTVPTLEEAGIPVACVRTSVTEVGVNSALEKVAAIGTAVGADATAGELVRKLEQRKAALEECARGHPKIRTLLIGDAPQPPREDEPGIPVAAGEPADALIELAGGTNVFSASAEDVSLLARLTSSTPDAAFEEYVKRAPDAVVIRPGFLRVETSSAWSRLEAVKQGRVFYLGDLSPMNVVENLEQVARFLEEIASSTGTLGTESPSSDGGGAADPITPSAESVLRYRLETVVLSVVDGAQIVVDPTPGPEDTYPSGAAVRLSVLIPTPVPCSGYALEFGQWLINGEPIEAKSTSITMIMDRDRVVTATFNEKQVGRDASCATAPA